MSNEDDKLNQDNNEQTQLTQEEIKTLQDEVVRLREAKESNQPSDDKVKENISKAYEDRDKLASEIATLKKEKRDAELLALEEAGKKEEADKIRMDTMHEELKAAQEQVTSLTRDNALRAELAASDFVSDKAAEVAYSDIVKNLIQDANGVWVSPTGQSISDYVKFYQNDEANRFLFKVKQSSGSQAMDGKAVSGQIKQTKPMSEMTTAELIEAADKGEFDGNATWV